MNSISIEGATAADATAVVTLFDRALLSFDRETITQRIDRGTVIVARQPNGLCGALLFAGNYVEAIAVKPGWRNRGIGRAMIERLAEERAPLTAGCREQVCPFFRSLGWTIYRLPGGRYFCRSPC